MTEGEAPTAEGAIPNTPRLISELRERWGPGRVEARQSAEQAAKQFLNRSAGRMTSDEVLEFGRLVSMDLSRGQEKHGRFSPAFVGATIKRLAAQAEDFNRWADQLWSRNDEDALAAVDELLTNPSALPGAGRSLPSLFMYLRDPDRFAIWGTSTDRGLQALTDYPGEKRQGGRAAYLRFCEAARAFRREHDVVPEELDAVLAYASSLATPHPIRSNDASETVVTREAFAFLQDLRSSNNSAWMDANRARYHRALRDPFRTLMEGVANRYIRDLDPEIDSEVKSGHVMASIKKRFSDEEGDYYPYYWGAFSRHRKQSDVQLFVIIHPDSLRFGFGLGSVPREALEAFRTNLPSSSARVWDALSAVRDRIQFRANSKEEALIDVRTPGGLIEWAQGPDPVIDEALAPDDPLIGTPELTEEVGRVLSALYPLAATAWGLPPGEQVEPEPDEPDLYTLEQLIADTLLPVDQLEEWIALLNGPKRQAILYGPPGTSKTWIASKLAVYLAGDSDRVATVQFHPSFSYEDFIEGLRPETGREAGIAYEIRPGVFQEFCDRARNHLSEMHVFVIDEINRADLGSVLGELMHLLEYRGTSIQLPYSKRRFSIPNNLILLATMNTADRSLALVDFALRRRFHAFPLPPDGGILARFLERAGSDPTLAVRFFDLVQERVGRTDFAPGHSYWMLADPSAAALLLVWRYELRPYLEEFWFENRSRLEELERDVAQMLAEEA